MHGTIESRFRVEWRPLAELAALASEWRALAGRALEPNVFYEPAFALAAQQVFGRGVGAGLVWSQSSEQRLLGLFPARIERRRYGVPLPVLVGWTHPFAPLGAPLVDCELGEAVIASWFDHLAHHPQLPKLVLLPYCPLEGPLARALDAAIARGHGRSVSFGRHARALLAPDGGREDYLDRALGRKKRKELRRQRNRLADGGVVMSSSVAEPSAVARALDDFLALEASGWKGRAGTAARAHDDIRKFMAAAVAGLAGEGKARVDRLLVDARPIAAAVTLKSGTTAWEWKIAYDETFARFSPGFQLLLDVTEGLLGDPAVARADSCATPDHPMIDHIWRERLVLADRLIRIGPDGSAAFAVARVLEAALRAAIAGAKAARGLVRR